jgi:hypothetical protein
MPRLATVISSPLLLLITAHARAKSDINSRWGREAESLCDFHEVEFVDVKDGAERVGGVGLEVGAVTVFCGL